jgi:hypothetical protein
MHADNMFSRIEVKDDEAILGWHRWAVAHGAHATGCSAARERESSSHTLLCVAINHLVNVAVLGERLEMESAIVGDPGDALLENLVRALRDSSAGGTRLIWRALEVHARDVGYAIQPWEAQAVELTAALLRDMTREFPTLLRPSPVEVARAALLELSDALADGGGDRMGVPGRLAAAMGYSAAVFMLAGHLLSR